jgi:2-oxoisovalerate ferredoxin oxidoreductase beta subunit
MSVFYEKFERHAHGEGLKARATHYCPGCGHGLAHKYLADAIEELGVQDRTIAISPVGCSVFLYYYFDVGNSQAAHGRAPAVALGHKLANPESIVVSYQGDGDLASIGLAEIVWAAQLGLPITVVFVNNAIYGMTGGQMAPTTLMGQKTATSPFGRDRLMGPPTKMAELVSQLEAPVYVERVALFDARQRIRAQKAILKALRNQVEGRGFSFVEVLAECPTHLKLTPEETEKWVKEEMLPVFPLGVKKDVAAEPWFRPNRPVFDPKKVAEVVGGVEEERPRFALGFPSHLNAHDVSLKLAGSGGDGAQTAAMLISIAAINEGFDATHIPSYGPESRGGTSYADVHVAAEEVLSPAAPKPDVLIAFNAPSLAKFGPTVPAGGTILYDSSVVAQVPVLDPRVRVLGVPFTEIAVTLGKAVVKNIVALGALQAATSLFPPETFLTAVREALKEKAALVPLNEAAFAAGMKSLAPVTM